METTCLSQEIVVVKSEATTAIESYEDIVNVLLDKINERKRLIESLTNRMDYINSLVKNFVCENDQADKVVLEAKDLIKTLRIFIALTKKSKLYSGYKTSLHSFIEAVNDFEEYMHDFKFRHNEEAQNRIQNLFKGFSLSI